MIEPNGPLPRSVYWRRRAVAAGGSVLAVVLLAWLIGGLVESGDQDPVQGTAGASVVAGARAPSGVRAPSSRPSAPPSSPGPNDPRGSVTASPPSDAPSSEGARPAPAPPTTTTPPAPPVLPGPCADAAMKVVAIPDVPSYPAGAHPLLRLQITNHRLCPLDACRAIAVLQAHAA